MGREKLNKPGWARLEAENAPLCVKTGPTGHDFGKGGSKPLLCQDIKTMPSEGQNYVLGRMGIVSHQDGPRPCLRASGMPNPYP